MMNSYNNAEIGYIMQAQLKTFGRYLYILVDKNLVDCKHLDPMTPAEASHYANLHNIERISSGSMSILRSDKRRNKNYLECVW